MVYFPNFNSTHYNWIEVSKDVVSLFGAILTTFGLFLNALSFKTAKFLDKYNSSMAFFQLLAIWDSIAILQDGLVNLGGRYFGHDFSTFSPLLCKLYYYHSICSSNVANYQLVALCVDRLTAVKFPIWYRSNGKPNLAYWVCFGIFSVNYVVYCPLLYFYNLINGSCYIVGDVVIINWVIRFHSFFILSGLPFLIILVINIYFIFYLRQTKDISPEFYQILPNAQAYYPKTPDVEQLSLTLHGKQRDILSICVIAFGKKSSSKQSSDKDRAERRMIVMLISVGFFFLFFTLTTGIGFALSIQFSPTTAEEKSLSDLLKIALEIPLIMNSSMNFVFFFLSGKGYRIAFKKMLRAQF